MAPAGTFATVQYGPGRYEKGADNSANHGTARQADQKTEKQAESCSCDR